MRLAILLSLAACGWFGAGVRADDGFRRVQLDTTLVGYVVPESFAAAHLADFETAIPGPVKIQGFWTPSDTNVIVADRALRVMIHDAAKNPLLLFPDLAPNPDPDTRAAEQEANKARSLERERRELALVSEHYIDYARQYVGIVVGTQKLIFCNYTIGTKADPELDYIFTERFFVDNGEVHFLQGRVDPLEKTCSTVSMIGPWGEKDDN